MVTDAQLQAAIAADPFHQALAQAEASGPQPDPFTVADMLEQLFPNASTEPSGVWDLRTRTKASATFRPGSTRARTSSQFPQRSK